MQVVTNLLENHKINFANIFSTMLSTLLCFFYNLNCFVVAFIIDFFSSFFLMNIIKLCHDLTYISNTILSFQLLFRDKTCCFYVKIIMLIQQYVFYHLLIILFQFNASSEEVSCYVTLSID